MVVATSVTPIRQNGDVGVMDIFSKRDRVLPAKDVLTYDKLPQPLCIQIVHIWTSTLGQARDYSYYDDAGISFHTWNQIAVGVAREHGVIQLATGNTGFEQAFNFLLNSDPPVAKALDVVEASFRVIDSHMRDNMWEFQRQGFGDQSADDAIAELNHRFLENGVGYQFANGRIVKLDSTYVHAEIIKPALQVIANKRFANVQTEFLRAHEHYRHARYEECLTDALKAFETTMKIICHERGWKYDQNDQAKTLIKTLLDNDLIPAHFQEQLTALRILLESGTPTARNKMGAHGMGVQSRALPEYIAAYGLHTAAANITLLVGAFEQRGR